MVAASGFEKPRTTSSEILLAIDETTQINKKRTLQIAWAIIQVHTHLPTQNC